VGGALFGKAVWRELSPIQALRKSLASDLPTSSPSTPLDPDAYQLWLDPWIKDVSAASDLLKPFDVRLMRCYPVSTRINNVGNDDAACSVPVEVAETQVRLF